MSLKKILIVDDNDQVRHDLRTALTLAGTIEIVGEAADGEVEDYQWIFAPTAVTLSNLTARIESTVPLALPILIVLGVGAALLIVWAKRHCVA